MGRPSKRASCNVKNGGQKRVSSPMTTLPVTILTIPTFVDSVDDHVEIFVPYTANEEHLDVVLYSDEFGVVDSRLLCQMLPFKVNICPDRRETKGWLAGKWPNL